MNNDRFAHPPYNPNRPEDTDWMHHDRDDDDSPDTWLEMAKFVFLFVFSERVVEHVFVILATTFLQGLVIVGVAYLVAKLGWAETAIRF